MAPLINLPRAGNNSSGMLFHEQGDNTAHPPNPSADMGREGIRTTAGGGTENTTTTTSTIEQRVRSQNAPVEMASAAAGDLSGSGSRSDDSERDEEDSELDEEFEENDEEDESDCSSSKHSDDDDDGKNSVLKERQCIMLGKEALSDVHSEDEHKSEVDKNEVGDEGEEDDDSDDDDDNKNSGGEKRDAVKIRFEVSWKNPRNQNHAVGVAGSVHELGKMKPKPWDGCGVELERDLDQNDLKDFWTHKHVSITSVAPGTRILYYYFVYDMEEEKIVSSEEKSGNCPRRQFVLPPPVDKWSVSDRKYGIVAAEDGRVEPTRLE